MFRNYFTNTNTTENDENGTENWSYPAGFERFNSVNIPRSRLGKRRTINSSAEVKRSILNGVTSDSRNDKDEFKSYISKTSSLTHPANSFLTPNYKKTATSLERNCGDGNENRNCDINIGHLTPFRNVGSYPLQEVNNFINDQNKILSTEKPLTTAGSSHQQQELDVKKILNKSFEVEKTEGTHIYSFSSNNGAAHSDSSHSDLCNNSSFMTAHDVYNLDKNRSYHDYLKTPGKGYGLFDMVASPLDALSSHTDDETDSLRNFLVKTPALSRFDPLHTPYRSQMKHDMYTPFKNKSRTPANSKPLVGVPEKEMECDEVEINVQDCLIGLEGSIKNKCSIGSGNKLSSKEIDKERLQDLAEEVRMNSTPLATISNSIKEPENEIKKTPPSVEKLVKRQIFEGLGWTIPHATFAIQSPVKQTPSTVVKKNSVTPNLEINLMHPILHKIEPEIRPKILHEALFENKCHTESENRPKSFEHCNGNEIGVSNPLPSSSNKSSNISDEKPFWKKKESIMHNQHNIFEEPPKHNLPIQDEISDVNSVSCSTYPNKTLKMYADETNVSAPSLKHPFTSDTNEASLKNGLTDKECTVVMCSVEPESKETITTMECNDTVILKQQNPQPQTIGQKPIVGENVDEKKEIRSSQEHFINEAPLFGCQRQIIRPPQTNIIYVNKKPYTVLSMLGRGGSSEVYQVLDANSSKLMALKFVNLSSVEDAVAKGYLNEIEVLSKLQGCPSVIKMFENEYISDNKILYVLMEKGDTDFSRLMKDITKTKKISMPMIIYYWTEMLNAVKDIHDKGIIHSDLKPANFLLVSGRLKLIDFGIASSLQGDMTSVLKDVTTGTFNYMSPEAIRNSGETRGYKINYKSDIWSLGCILYNLLYGRTPFSHLTNTWTKLQAIADPDTAVSFPSSSTAPPHLLLSVRWALTKDPKQRPTAEELLRLAELTPGPETQLGRQISSLLGEYIYQMFPNCRVRFEIENPKDRKQTNNFPH